ncbi:queE 7-carboxy-7-deazaguanine synthase [uncultured Caudovirales phage]|uniref:QueE 7-carboxy-7-deazaguanine synthase n=1 Tax=uncultured Caudovirales phage TaxID=2100421 RepID=A0A6J5L7Q9_9CAUD|nr:queE 7-carboxy-7-deazaguanine synthase [uncultured Caudovirales phage]
MNQITSIGFALDPTNVPSFLLDWELTKLCNLDCSYCPTGINGGHDNTTKHPPLTECLQTIDFMFEYVDEYMKYKKPSQRKVILNVYGGESLFHPNIVEILDAVRNKYTKYQDNWYLTVTCTTNGVIGQTLWSRIVPLIDEFTVSYHAENLPKQKQQVLNNLLYLKENNRRFKCVVMMHNDPVKFEDSKTVIDFCQTNNLRYIVKPLDNQQPEWQYTGEQYKQLKTFWMVPVTEVKNNIQAIKEGRSCCGGRRLSLNGNLKSNVGFVQKQGFEGWSCSVNWFFLFVRQVDGAVFTNKDCRMSTSGKEEPLGNISDSKKIISTLQTQLETSIMPVIKCRKNICRCGFCAPKAETEKDFIDLIKRNVPFDVFQKEC